MPCSCRRTCQGWGRSRWKESDGEESRRRYLSRVNLPPNLYKFKEIKAEMKNGVLRDDRA